MKKVLFVTLFFIGILGAVTAQGELEERIQEKRVAFFNEELQLTEAEANQFWPLYDQYRKDDESLKKSYTGNKKIALMSDQEVEDYIIASFELQEKQIALKRQYFERFRTFLPIRKIAMLKTAERKFKRKLLQHVKQQRQNRRKGDGAQRGRRQ